MALERERGEVQARGPAFGAIVQDGQIGRVELELESVVQQRRRLLAGEAQVGALQLEQLAACPEPSQGKRRVGVGRHDELHGLGKVFDEERDRAMAFRFSSTW